MGILMSLVLREICNTRILLEGAGRHRTDTSGDGEERWLPEFRRVVPTGQHRGWLASRRQWLA